MKRVLVGLLLAGSALIGLPQAGHAATALTVAVVPNYPPMEFRDPATNALMGFDIDLGQAIAAHMGRSLTWQETSFDQMLPSLDSGRVDAVLSGMSDLATRHKAATFVDYLHSGPQFFVLSSAAAKVKTMADVCGKRVGASRRTSFPKEITAWSLAHCGSNAVQVVGTDGSADARIQLKQGRIDAAVQGGETLPYIMQQEPNTYTIVGKPFASDYTAIALPVGNTGLQEAVSGALSSMIADGSYQKIAAKWHLTPYAVDKVLINAGQ